MSPIIQIYIYFDDNTVVNYQGNLVVQNSNNILPFDLSL